MQNYSADLLNLGLLPELAQERLFTPVNTNTITIAGENPIPSAAVNNSNVTSAVAPQGRGAGGRLTYTLITSSFKMGE
ncbi:MAG: hypothetical protein HC796_00825 [Synechococcaceae cyanobacterium RL_1_2]|nr:hypothetical protein [Synechococcaceae cyanobacterium RL_1_2]